MRFMRVILVCTAGLAAMALPREDAASLGAAVKQTGLGAYAIARRMLVAPEEPASGTATTSKALGSQAEMVSSAPTSRPVATPAVVELRGSTQEHAQPVPAKRLTFVADRSTPGLWPTRAQDVEDKPAHATAPADARIADAGVIDKPVVVAADAASQTADTVVPAPQPAVRPARSVVAESPAAPPATTAPKPEPASAPDSAASGATEVRTIVPSTAVAAPPPPLPATKPEPPKKKPPVAANLLFGTTKTAAPLAARAIGFYSRGCLAGAKALPVDGPAWQAMRLSRNRNWGHPQLVALLERFAQEVQKEDGWSGLLIGDMSQPRGGPMLTGHASHQVGLDADIWLTPMPGRRLSKSEREAMSAVSMIDGPTRVDPTVFTANHVKVIKRAASYPQVERILVHPAIKKALCDASPEKERGWLYKVRPYFGHHYHFHVRLSCPKDSPGCKSQPPPRHVDGCGKELDDWIKRLSRPKRVAPRPPIATLRKPRKAKPPITIADLPKDCKVVLETDNEAVKEIDRADLEKAATERTKKIIDISGTSRSDLLAARKKQD
ncbi:MAG: penicillin-insensitive murein endopeptidase [Hyphomicrobiaceae bacterium]